MSAVRQAEIAGLPPFAGGAVGFFGFDCVRAVERLPEPNPDVIGLPDMALMLSDVIVAFDHLRHTVTILANAYLDDESTSTPPTRRAVEAIRAVRARLAGPLPAFEPHGEREEPTFEPNMPREQFEANVARIIEYIHAGDAYQVVPSQRWSAPTPVEPFSHLPRPARRQPEPVHVLPRLRGLPDRRRLARAAADGQRPPRLARARSPAPGRAARTTPRSRPSCSPTRRSAPST